MVFTRIVLLRSLHCQESILSSVESKCQSCCRQYKTIWGNTPLKILSLNWDSILWCDQSLWSVLKLFRARTNFGPMCDLRVPLLLILIPRYLVVKVVGMGDVLGASGVKKKIG